MNPVSPPGHLDEHKGDWGKGVWRASGKREKDNGQLRTEPAEPCSAAGVS